MVTSRPDVIAYFLGSATGPTRHADFPVSSTTLSPDFGDKVHLSTMALGVRLQLTPNGTAIH